MNRAQLSDRIRSVGSYLCVGLDTDPEKIPDHLRSEPNPVLAFNKAIIEATQDHCISYKINTAFYEAQGAKGWETMSETLACIPDTHLTIADAKRGDIGNTSGMYARAFFKTMSFDAITAAPYMGHDSLAPFFEFPDKWVIVLALTSNPGSADFEQQKVGEQKLYERVLETFAEQESADQLMFVVGATKAKLLAEIRQIIPDHFLLVPGVGAQGGNLEEVAQYGMNKDVGLLVNASRSIIYASSGVDFAKAAKAEASKLHEAMRATLS